VRRRRPPPAGFPPFDPDAFGPDFAPFGPDFAPFDPDVCRLYPVRVRAPGMLRDAASEVVVFGIGMPELLIILVVALLVLGPRKLPEAARSLGRGMAEFRRASSDLRNSLTAPIDEIKETVADLDREPETADEAPSPPPAPSPASDPKRDG